jgi:Protein of unknown function (DUF3775)
MLDLNPETIRFIVDKAQEFQVETETEPDADDDLSPETRADALEHPAYQELKTTIDDLEPDQQVALVALMWLGRGDYSVDEWNAALAHARDSWNARTAEYLIGTPLVADYLSQGLEELGY